MSSHALVELFQAVTLAGAALTVGRLSHNGLRARYPIFFCYFTFWILNSVWPFFLDASSHAYFWLWVCTEPINWIFYVLIVWELCGLVLEKHPGLVTLGRWAMYSGLAVSVLISFLTLIPSLRSAGPQWQTTRYLLAADRAITLSLVIFLLLMMFLIKNYPVCLSRNVILHATLFTIFFISNTIGAIFQGFFGTPLYTAVDSALMAISALCVLVWLFFLTPEGEQSRVNLPHFAPADEERLLHRLNALNATMLRVARK